jgi:hypothetical protein
MALVMDHGLLTLRRKADTGVLGLFYTAAEAQTYSDDLRATPSNVQGAAIKSVAAGPNTTPTFQWQASTTPVYLAGSRAGGPAIYMDAAQLKILSAPVLWDPTTDWTMSFVATPREDAAGTIKQWFSKASLATGPWLFRSYFKRPELVSDTGNSSPATWDMNPVVPRGPEVVVFKWQASTSTFTIRVNGLKRVTRVGALPSLDVVNDYYLGGALGGNSASTEFMDVRYWQGRTSDAADLAHTYAMQRQHCLGQCYIVAWGDSLTDDNRANWIFNLSTTLVTAGVYRPIINCGLGGQCLSNLPLTLGNSMELQYAAREKGLVPDPGINSVFMGFEWVNEINVHLQLVGWTSVNGAPYDANLIVSQVITAFQAVIAQAVADGYKVCVVANMYDCITSYVPLDIKHALNAALALLFPTAHPRVANVLLPAVGGTFSGDYMLDFAALTHLGGDGDNADTAYFAVDGIHEGPGAAAIKALPAKNLIVDWQTNPPAKFVLPASQDTTSNLLVKLGLNGDTTDSSGNGNDFSTSGTVTYQAGLIGQEAILAAAGNILHADATQYRFFRVGSTGFQCVMQIKPNSFPGVPFYAQKNSEWEIRGSLSGGNGDLAFRIFDGGGSQIGIISLATGTLVSTKPIYVSWGADAVNKIMYLCVDGQFSFATYTGTPNTGTANNIVFGGTAGNFANEQVGEIRIYSACPAIDTFAHRAAARLRERAIRVEMGLGYL